MDPGIMEEFTGTAGLGAITEGARTRLAGVLDALTSAK